MGKIVKVGVTKLTGHESKRRRKMTRESGSIGRSATEMRIFADKLVHEATESELLFCDLLDKMGFDYKFQEPILGYVPDFFFPNHKNRIIELDGAYHRERRERDARKDATLKKHGYRVLRIPSSLIFRDVDKLMRITRDYLLGSSKKAARIKREKRVEVFESEAAFLSRVAGI